MKKNYIDMHIHSCYSDGTYTLQEILKIGKSKGLCLFTVTDHDELEGCRQLQALCQKEGVPFITGVEIDCLENGVNYHVLAYGFDINHKEFNLFILETKSKLEEVNEKLILKLNKDYPWITLDDYHSFTYPATQGGWKTLHYLVEKKLAKTPQEAMSIYSRYQHGYDCVDFPTMATVCKQIHQAKGKAILAHPNKQIPFINEKQFELELVNLFEQGLDGIECYYPSHSQEVRACCLQFCQNHNAIVTAGCDCHGTFATQQINEMECVISHVKYEKLMDRIEQVEQLNRLLVVQ